MFRFPNIVRMRILWPLCIRSMELLPDLRSWNNLTWYQSLRRILEFNYYFLSFPRIAQPPVASSLPFFPSSWQHHSSSHKTLFYFSFDSLLNLPVHHFSSTYNYFPLIYCLEPCAHDIIRHSRSTTSSMISHSFLIMNVSTIPTGLSYSKFTVMPMTC